MLVFWARRLSHWPRRASHASGYASWRRTSLPPERVCQRKCCGSARSPKRPTTNLSFPGRRLSHNGHLLIAQTYEIAHGRDRAFIDSKTQNVQNTACSFLRILPLASLVEPLSSRRTIDKNSFCHCHKSDQHDFLSLSARSQFLQDLR